MTCPSSARKSAALTPVVPRSIPSSACILPPLFPALRNNAIRIRFIQPHRFVDDAIALDGVGVGACLGKRSAVKFARQVVDEGPLQHGTTHGGDLVFGIGVEVIPDALAVRA